MYVGLLFHYSMLLILPLVFVGEVFAPKLEALKAKLPSFPLPPYKSPLDGDGSSGLSPKVSE
jgi:hypothetical protein